MADSTATSVRDEKLRALRKVQQRVMAVGFVTVALHGVIGAIAAAYVIDGQGRHSDAIMMVVISAVIAVLTYFGTRLILQRSLWAPVWFVIALLPSVLAMVWFIRT